MARNLQNYRFQKTIVLWYLNFVGFQYHTSIVLKIECVANALPLGVMILWKKKQAA